MRARIPQAAHAILLLLVLLPTHTPAQFREPAQPGPFNARIVRVIEGDHFDLTMQSGPLRNERIRFRLSTVNTPSPFSDQPCEERLGVEVTDFVADYVRGKRIRVRELRRGRNSFEQVGLLDVDGQDLGELLLSKGFAVPFNDSSRNPERRAWPCEDAPPAPQPSASG